MLIGVEDFTTHELLVWEYEIRAKLQYNVKLHFVKYQLLEASSLHFVTRRKYRSNGDSQLDIYEECKTKVLSVPLRMSEWHNILKYT